MELSQFIKAVLFVTPFAVGTQHGVPHCDDVVRDVDDTGPDGVECAPRPVRRIRCVRSDIGEQPSCVWVSPALTLPTTDAHVVTIYRDGVCLEVPADYIPPFSTF